MSFKDSIDDINNVTVTELSGVTSNPSTAMNVQAKADGTFALAEAGGGGGSLPSYSNIGFRTTTNTQQGTGIAHSGSGNERWVVSFLAGGGASSGNVLRPSLSTGPHAFPNDFDNFTFAMNAASIVAGSLEANGGTNNQSFAGIWDNDNSRFQYAGAAALTNWDSALFPDSISQGGWLKLDLVISGSVAFSIDGANSGHDIVFYRIQ